MGGTMKTQSITFDGAIEGDLVRDIRTAPGFSARAARIEAEGSTNTMTSAGTGLDSALPAGIVTDVETTKRASFGERLMERKLVQWTVGYVAMASWLLQVTGDVSVSWGWSGLVQQTVSLLLGMGLVPAVVIAWYHGEKGRQRVCTAECALLGATALASAVLVWSLYFGKAL